ncbi:hypothetical protein HK100_008858 [Physocladia obscura]|uniref:Uncharacterized protein n=1 Tax=Physocladia obscura TaxID=109957 RepID=A0AAD5XI64_9FUNG|nr:hypothetical protein HK100_008858 [Physocladia obscura]
MKAATQALLAAHAFSSIVDDSAKDVKRIEQEQFHAAVASLVKPLEPFGVSITPEHSSSIPKSIRPAVLKFVALRDTVITQIETLKQIIEPLLPWESAENTLFITSAIFFVYFVGYFNFGIAWVFVAMFFVNAAYRRNMLRIKDKVSVEASRVLGLRKLETEDETVEWFNRFLDKFWVQYEPGLSFGLKESIGSTLASIKPAFLDDLVLTVFTLGSVAPRIDKIKTIMQPADDLLVMEWSLLFVPVDEDGVSKRERELGNVRQSQIEIVAKLGLGKLSLPIPILVGELEFRAKLRLELKFVSKYPHVSKIDYSFDETPVVDFILKPLKALDMMDMPALRSALDKGIAYGLAGFVMPNKNTIDLDAIMNGTGTDLPVGILKITIHEAKHLKNMELAGTSDPYVAVRIGGVVVGKSKIVTSNLHPFWGHTIYIPVLKSNLNRKQSDPLNIEELHFEILDSNPASKDVSMGFVQPLNLARWVKLLDEPEPNITEISETEDSPTTPTVEEKPTPKINDTKSLSTAKDNVSSKSAEPKPSPAPAPVFKPSLSGGLPLSQSEIENLVTEWGSPQEDSENDVWHALYMKEASTKDSDVKPLKGSLRIEMAYFPVKPYNSPADEPKKETKATTTDLVKNELEQQQQLAAVKTPAIEADFVAPEKSSKSRPSSRQLTPAILRQSASLSEKTSFTSLGAASSHAAATATAAKVEAKLVPIETTGILTATIHSGKEFRSSRMNSMKCELALSGVVAPPASNDWVVGATPVVKKTNNPTWDYPIRFYVASPDTAKLVFTVKDGNRSAGDLKLKVADVLKRLNSKEVDADWYKLGNCESGKVRITFQWHTVDPDYIVPSHLTLARKPKGIVKFKILHAKSLVNVEIMGRKSDPYAKIYIGHSAIGATMVKDNTLDPVWNETFYGVSYSAAQRVMIELWDYNNVKMDKKLGTVDLTFNDILYFYDDGVEKSKNFQKSRNDGLTVEFVGHSINVTAPIYVDPRADIEIAGLKVDLKGKIKKEKKESDTVEVLNTLSAEINANHNAREEARSHLAQRGFVYFEIEYYHAVALDEQVSALDGDQRDWIARTQELVKSEVKRLEALAEVKVLTKEESERRIKTVLANGYAGEPDKAMLPLLSLRPPAKIVEKYDSGILRFNLIGAKNVGNLNAYIDIQLDDISVFETRVQKSDSPVWNASTDVCIRSFKHQKLIINLRESKHGETRHNDDPILATWGDNLLTIVGKKKNWIELEPSRNGAAKVLLNVSVGYVPIETSLSSTIYDHGMLYIDLHSATNVEGVDASGTSDPYCLIYLNDEQLHKTETKKKNNNPVFKESINVPIQSRLKSTINFVLKDFNAIARHTTIGTAELDLMDLSVDKPLTLALPLAGARSGVLNLLVYFDHEAVANLQNKLSSNSMNDTSIRLEGDEGNAALKMIKGSGLGTVDAFKDFAKTVKGAARQDQGHIKTAASVAREHGFEVSEQPVFEVSIEDLSHGSSLLHASSSSLQQQLLHGTVLLTIESAHDLKAVDNNGLADPYIKVNQLLHGKVKNLYKTKVKKATLNPIWHETCQFKIPPSSITLELKDHNTFASSKPLGQIDLNLEALFGEETEFSTTLPVSLGGKGEVTISGKFEKDASGLEVGARASSSMSMASETSSIVSEGRHSRLGRVPILGLKRTTYMKS